MLTAAHLEAVVAELPQYRSKAPREIDFNLISRLLGLEFPSDYKDLVRSYPTLELDGFIRILTPRPGVEESFVAGIWQELEILRDLQEEDMSEGYVAHPAPGGLVPWSETLSGDVFYWRVAGVSPDEWPVVVNSRNHEWWEFDGGAVAFLVGLIDGSIEHRGLPANVPSRNPSVVVFED